MLKFYLSNRNFNSLVNWSNYSENRVPFSTLFRVGLFGASHGCKKVPSLSLRSVTHILQWWNLVVILYLKKVLKCTNHVTHLLISTESLKIVLIKMAITLMMSARLTTLGLLKIKAFWNKAYDIIIFVHGVTNKVLSRGSNCIVNFVMWPKFGNSSIFMREVIIT